ncbi:hypothetical protein BGW36DRAFT_380313 [Talaromyces proteolyticus]|uniref:F-box domain-containing protein n=1 Tax=Talaromyces proteolyticus TaxID=1131652 RepID=A0AAD4KMK5_9EURO|nr:uncharacterized protein BGW36DRAFT_380313 [Talaromyces proteolyticus]KAH8696133.1 hypothetical protein BGW36DRAFT_380313 [Talaromyces proteolyticus]
MEVRWTIPPRDISSPIDQDPSDGIPRAPFIFSLPDELLSRILELVIVNDTDEWQYRYVSYITAKIPAVAYTCRRFSRIIIPFSYHTIRIDRLSTKFKSISVRKLLRTFQEDPSLGRYCHELRIFKIDTRTSEPEDDFYFVEQIIPFLSNVKSLYVSGGFGPDDKTDTWNLIRSCTKHMPRLEEVELRRQSKFGLELADIMMGLQVPTLKYLKAFGITSRRDSPFHILGGIQAATFTNLHLGGYQGTSEAIGKLLAWPDALSECVIRSFQEVVPELNLMVLRTMLFKHRKSLKVLDIGNLVFHGLGELCDLSEFEALESLTLSKYQLKRQLDENSGSHDNAAELLLGPRLKIFRWCFANYDGYPEEWSEFGEREAAWLRTFAEAAVAKRASLKEIRIRFIPEPNSATRDSYPWDRLDKLNDEFSPHGIAFSYSTPPMSREDWLKLEN